LDGDAEDVPEVPVDGQPRLADASAWAEKSRIGRSFWKADSVLRALDVPLLPCAMVTVCDRL
jgi:hypothetical protein